MRAYLIDEIPRSGLEKIKGFLEKAARRSSMEAVYWGRIPDDLLSEEQYDHRDCRPHVFGIELGDDWLKMELFVRPLHNMRCTCCAYATRRQRDFILHFADTMMEDLDIRT